MEILAACQRTRSQFRRTDLRPSEAPGPEANRKQQLHRDSRYGVVGSLCTVRHSRACLHRARPTLGAIPQLVERTKSTTTRASSSPLSSCRKCPAP